jgi:immunoglobulin-binding protein 1
MAEELLEAQPLPHLFEQAQQIYLLASSSQVEPTEIRKACRMLQEAQDKIETLALFSANEDKEDISTADLKYLLVPYYLGYLTEKLPVEDRAELVKVAKVQLLVWLSSGLASDPWIC